MGEKYAHKVWDHFVHHKSTILEKKMNFVLGCPSDPRGPVIFSARAKSGANEHCRLLIVFLTNLKVIT